MPQNMKAIITNRDLQKKFTYKGVETITLDISYPEIQLEHNLPAQNYINTYYQNQANRFSTNTATKLQKEAIENYEYATKNNYPFHAFDAVMKYNVTLNDNCHLSTYTDQYQYTGGAHGSTVRTSANWSLNTGKFIEMEDLFSPGENYTQLVVAQILLIANEQIRQNNFIYFDDYKELIVKNFNLTSFNLNPTDMTVYYQQYDIGPYASGIIEFNIPYSKLGIPAPSCFL